MAGRIHFIIAVYLSFSVFCNAQIALPELDLGKIVESCTPKTGTTFSKSTIHTVLNLAISSFTASTDEEGDDQLSDEDVEKLREILRWTDLKNVPFDKVLEDNGRSPAVPKIFDIENILTNVNELIANPEEFKSKLFSIQPLVGEIYSEKCEKDWDAVWGPLKEHGLCYVAHIVNDLGIVTIPRLILAALRPSRPLADWTLKYVDALVKLPAGVMEGKLSWLGGYEECYDISTFYNGSLSTVGDTVLDWQGRYCRLDIQGANASTDARSLSVGFCIPESCTSDALQDVINAGQFLFFRDKIRVNKAFCGYHAELGDDPVTVLTIVVIMTLIVICLIASFYDIFFRAIRMEKLLDENEIHPVNVNNNLKLVHINIKPDRQISNVYAGEEFESTVQKNEEKMNGNVITSEERSEKTSSQISIISRSHYIKEGNGTQGNIMDLNDIKVDFKDRLEMVFVGFSFYSNMRRLFRSKTKTTYFHSLDAIRFISFLYAMYGYTYLFGIVYTESFTTGNLLITLPRMIKEFQFQIVINFHYCADSFFVVSGCLVAYQWLNRMHTQRDGKIGLKDVLYFYFHRYWRLMVPMMFVILFYTSFYKFVLKGPLTPPQITDADNCRSSWWINALMLHNLIGTDEMCLTWVWYVPTVFQLHLVAPLILFPLVYKRKISKGIGYVFLCLCLLGSAAGLAIVSQGIYADNLGFGGWFYDLMMTPWCRGITFFIGIALGISLFEIKKHDSTVKIPGPINILVWLVAIGLLLVCTFMTYDRFKEGGVKWSEEENILYNTLSRVAWGLSISWMIFACETGNGGIINDFLSYPAFRPLSKLVYMAVLVSAIMIFRNAYTQMNLIYIYLGGMVYFAIGNSVFSLIAASAFVLIFQYPFLGIERAILCRNKLQYFLAGTHPQVKDKNVDPNDENDNDQIRENNL